MSAPPEARRSLAELAGESGDLTRRWVWGFGEAVRLDALLDSALAWTDTTRRRVLLAFETQLAVVEGLLALDGRAAGLVLRPPDMPRGCLSGVVEAGALDAIMADPDAAALAPGARRLQRAAFGVSRARGLAKDGDARAADTEWLMFTSGTSGGPKMVVHTLAGLIDPIRTASPGAAMLSVWGTFYDIRRYGGLQILLRALLGTGSLVLSDAREPVGAHLLRLGRRGVTHLSGTPSHWRRALMRPEIEAIAPRYVRLSGEIADQALLDRLQAAFPEARVAHAYASTEAGVGFEVDDGLEGLPARLVDAGGTPEVDMRLVDDSLRLRSRRVALGYAHAGAPALADVDGFIDTGDLLERRGERLHFVGRRGGVINVGGLKVHPEEVEAVINRHPAVRMSRVRARRSALVGALVVAEIVPLDDDLSAASTASLRIDVLAHCRAELEAHKRPISITICKDLTLTSAGKLDRRGA